MTDINITKRVNRTRRQNRGRAKIAGTAERPRVTVFKSNAHVYVQAIDDATGKTIAAVSDAKLTGIKPRGGHAPLLGVKPRGGHAPLLGVKPRGGHAPLRGTKTDHAAEAGKKLAGLLKEKGVTVVVFDKAGFKYHGRIKAVAEALRAGGIKL